MLKKHPTLGVWLTPKSGSAFNFLLKKKDRLCLIRRHVNFQQHNQFIKSILSHLKKIIFNHSEGVWEGQNKYVPYSLFQAASLLSWVGWVGGNNNVYYWVSLTRLDWTSQLELSLAIVTWALYSSSVCMFYCQAQPQLQLSWVELVIFSTLLCIACWTVRSPKIFRLYYF